MSNIALRIKALVDELDGLEWELCRATRDKDAIHALIDEEDGVRLIGRLKVSVDNMRRFLWAYIETCSANTHQSVDYALQSARLDRVTELLQVLRQEGVSETAAGPRCIADVVYNVMNPGLPLDLSGGTPLPTDAGVVLRSTSGDWIGMVRNIGQRGLLFQSVRGLKVGDTVATVLHCYESGMNSALSLIVHQVVGESYAAVPQEPTEHARLLIASIQERQNKHLHVDHGRGDVGLPSPQKEHA